ncbi:NAD-dependent epimerase/dehydratase family protein, partial [Streptomyces sp. NPDC059083]|uniref:NAD-dependent epimerase/dehydratase family protein n=1 Tax=Streptomyces sp. NPDC059083 TaxID=3346721 RepID=UPI003685330A
MDMNDTKNILLAGASGVLGGHITRALQEHGYTVLSLGRGAGNGLHPADLLDPGEGAEALLEGGGPGDQG